MPWFKVDDTFALHPKVMQAGNSAIGLWVRAGSWSAQQLTDGHVPAFMLPPLGGKPAEAKRLVESGLWVEVEGGYAFHDWKQAQPLREQVKADREAERVRKAVQRAKSRCVKSHGAECWDSSSDTCRKSRGVPLSVPLGHRPDSGWDSGLPDPTRPDHLTTNGSDLLHLTTEPRETDGVKDQLGGVL